jgi:DNA replication and repair protein RecF
LRGAAFEELARHGGTKGWAVAGEVEGRHGAITLGTAWAPPPEDGEAAAARQVEIAGEAQKSSGAFSDHVRMLWLTPAMDRLFSGPAGDRRRFLDRLVMAFDAEHGRRVLVFERLLRERNRVLAEPASDQAWLGGIEQQLAETGVAVAAARVTAVEALQLLIEEARAARGGTAFPWAGIRVTGDLESLVKTNPAVQVEDEYRRVLRDGRAQDRAAGRTLNGPQRSDLAVVHGPKGIDARDCSTGEQKALLIGLVLAHASAVRTAFEGWTPLLLLDEIAAHLDEDRRAGLFAALEELEAQAWMTGTDARLFEPLVGKAQFFRIDSGKAVAMRP